MSAKIRIVASMLALTAGVLTAEIVDWTIATVDEETITYSELMKSMGEMRIAAAKFGTPGMDLGSPAAVLDRLVSSRILTLEAKKNAIDVSENEINERKEMFKKMNNLDDNLFRQVLKQQNISMKELEDNYREQIRNEKLQQMEIRSKVKPPSEDEMWKFYNDNIDKMTSPPKVRVLSILVKDRPESKLEERVKMQKTLETIVTRLKAGVDFAKLVSQYSEDEASKDKGGDLGWIEQGSTAPELEQMAFKLPVGEVSPPFQTRWGFNIIKVVDRKKPSPVPYETAKANIKNAIMQKNLQEAFISWIEDKKRSYGIRAMMRDGAIWTFEGGTWTTDTGKKRLNVTNFNNFFNGQFKNGTP